MGLILPFALVQPAGKREIDELKQEVAILSGMELRLQTLEKQITQSHH